MKLLILTTLTLLTSSNAFAVNTCESTVVPLALEMAKASGNGSLINLHFVSVSADYTEIGVVLGNYDGSELGKFKMTMGEDYKQVRKCVVKKVEAL